MCLDDAGFLAVSICVCRWSHVLMNWGLREFTWLSGSHAVPSWMLAEDLWFLGHCWIMTAAKQYLGGSMQMSSVCLSPTMGDGDEQGHMSAPQRKGWGEELSTQVICCFIASSGPTLCLRGWHNLKQKIVRCRAHNENDVLLKRLGYSFLASKREVLESTHARLAVSAGGWGKEVPA